MKKAVWLSVGLVSVAAITAAGGWYWWQGQQAPEAKSSSGGSVSLGDKAPVSNEQALEMNGETLTQSAGSGGSGGSSGSGGGSATPKDNTSEAPVDAALPGPAQFGQYEQYKDAAGPMYIEIEEGKGAVVGANSKLSVDYRGWLTNGQLFDESYSRGKRFDFAVGQGVILGWSQGVIGMKAGGKRRLIIPPAFGYKDQAVGGIPANSVLVFDIWVHEVK